MKILHVTYGFNGGGVGFVIANYCAGRETPGISFDIVGEDIGQKHMLHERFEKAGFGVHYVVPKGKNLLKNIQQVYRIMKHGGYDGVHVHFEEWSFLYLMLAWLCGIKKRVCHAHMAYMPGSDTKPHYKLFRVLLNWFATDRLACSKDAGEHLYGEHKYEVLNNAIEAKRYRFAPEVREAMRRSLKVEQKLVIGVVGRLSYQKNPQKTISIFEEIRKKRQDAVLLMVGQGELENEVRQLIEQNGLTDSVQLLGMREDVPQLLQAMDIFLLPSRWEGLGMVYIEAQAAGLHTFGTAGVVPAEARICSDLMTYMPIDATSEQWADTVLSVLPYERRNMMDQTIMAGYDLEYETQHLMEIYCRKG